MRLILALFLAILIPTISFGDRSNQRGVLPDGTPFRVDVDGNQIVDYIAELENAIDNLNRRIYGLESDVADKDRVIHKLSGSTSGQSIVLAREDRLKERDLVSGDLNDGDFYGTRAHRLEGELEANPSHNNVAVDHTEELQKLAEERKKLDEERSNLEGRLHEREQTLARTHADASELRRMVAEREQEIETLRNDFNDLKMEYATVSSQSTSQKNLLREQESKLEELKSKQLVEGANLQAGLSNSMKPADTKSMEVVSALPSIVSRSNRQDTAPMASLSNSRAVAMESAKGMMRTELNQLRDLMGKRASLHAGYKKNSSAAPVTFNLTPLRSKRGVEMANIGSAIDKAERMNDLALSKNDISEIRMILQEDIAFIDRMNRRSSSSR